MSSTSPSTTVSAVPGRRQGTFATRTAGPATGQPDTAQETVLGLLRLAGVTVALPLAVLREVLPCPPELAGLPMAAVGLLGAIDLRDLVLPVLDLQPVLGREAKRRREQVVVVLASGGQALGLLADQVLGVLRVPAVALQTVTVKTGQGRPALFSHTFRHPTDGSTVSVLDAEAVLALPDVPTVQDTNGTTSSPAVPAGPPAPRATGGTYGRPLVASPAPPPPDRSTPTGKVVTLVQCGPYRVALDVAAVHTTLTGSAIRPSVLGSALCRGVIDFDDREVPLVDLLVLLGFPPLPVDDYQAGLVLDLGRGFVVLALSALLSLHELDHDEVLSVPGFALARPDLLLGLTEIEGSGTCLVLDQEALLAEPELVGLAAVNTALDGPELPATTRSTGASRTDSPVSSAALTSDGAAAGDGPAYLTYRAGPLITTALGQVTEILPLPSAVTASGADPNLLGIMVHRGAAVPVLSLPGLLGRVPLPAIASSCLLLVAVGKGHVAFAVDALHGLNPLTWTDPQQTQGHSAGPDVLGSCRLVQVRGQSDLLPDVDLQGLAQALTERNVAPALQSAWV